MLQYQLKRKERRVTLKDHLTPKKDWTPEMWLQHAWVMVHSPWIDEEEREYWKYKIKELS